MKLKASQIIISPEKIVDYLLVKKNKNDKSYFLQELGYTIDNYEIFISDILQIALSNQIILSRSNEYENLYTIQGLLRSSVIITVWIEQIHNNIYRFVTLYPANYKNASSGI